MGKYRIHIAFLHQFAPIQNGNVGADLADHGHFVGDDHDGDAQRAVELFQQIEDLMNVKGIGRAKYDAIADLITI